MRNVTADEAHRWTALAEQHGHTNENGEIALGRFVTHPDQQGYGLTLELVTPMIAGIYTGNTLAKKDPPIMFDRTPDGELIVPGRWFQHMFERLGDDADIDPDIADTANRVARGGIDFGDALLSVDFETIAFQAPDEEGNLVTFEAIPPETRIRVEAEQGV